MSEFSRLGIAALVVLLGGVLGCSRVRDIPITELPKLNAITDRSATAVVLWTTNRKRARIESFSRLAFMREVCTTPRYCDAEQEYHVDEVRRIRLFRDRIELDGRRHERRGASIATQVIRFDDSNRWARLSKRSLSRGAIIGATATIAAVAVGAMVTSHSSPEKREPNT
jgi:hypothetical protein